MSAQQINFPNVTEIKSQVKFGSRTRAFLFGSSGSGKSTYIHHLLSDLERYFDPAPSRVLYFHRTLANEDFLLNNKIELRSDDPSNLVAELEADPSRLKNSLIILDDALNYIKSKAIVSLFTRLSNHSDISVMFVSQQLFGAHASLRTVYLNCNHFCLFSSPNDPSSVNILSSRLFPQKPRFLSDALRQVSQQSPYSPLHISTRPNFFLDQFRVFSGFLEGNFKLTIKSSY